MKKFIYTVSAAATLLTMGCQKTLDINDNPNAPTESNMQPSVMLAKAEHSMASQMATAYPQIARWIGYWTRSGSYGPSAEEETYNITNNFGSAIWAGWYNVLYDLHVIEQKAKERNEKVYEAIARILKTVGFMHLVDLYNNIPYSQAFDVVHKSSPAYDKAEDIYTDLFKQLDEAVALLQEGLPGDSPNINQSDVIFHGSTEDWLKFANTQRLRLLIHLSQVNNVDVAAQIAKITAEGFLGSEETAYVQPGYVMDNNKQNPFWDAFHRLYTGDIADNYNRANNFSLNLMRNAGDIRYQSFFRPAVTPIGGNTYFGYDYGFIDPDPDNPKAANSSMVNGPGLAASPSAAQWFLTSTESMFLQAEAIQRGWIAGDAKTAYQNAVKESFIWLRAGGSVAAATTAANNYLASGEPLVDWDKATTPAAKLALIGTQKYIALLGIDIPEAYADYRRLGVPNIPLSLAPNHGPNIPVRLRYPQSEYNYNADNVSKQNNPNPFSANIFWDK